MSDQSAEPEGPNEPIPCPPCRGTGQVISNLGGSPSTVTCPWCEGSGVFQPEHDAQAAKKAERGEEPAAEQPAGEPQP